MAFHQAGLRRWLYSHLFDALGERGLSAIYGPKFAGVGVIFMYHRVIEDGDITLYPGYSVTTTELQASLETVRRAGWKLVSLDQMCAALREGHSGERLACFTFDDGYNDNLTRALPIFRRFEAPMCVYAATGIVDRTMWYWWGALEQMIQANDDIEVDLPEDPLGPHVEHTATLQQKLDAFRRIDAWCHAHSGVAAEHLGRLFRRYDVHPDALLDRDALTVTQLRELAHDPLVTIGSHGVTHRRMSGLSDSDLEDELTTSRCRLEEVIDRQVRHIAYPFGSRQACGRREFEAAARNGYVSGVTTRRGNLFPSHRDYMLSLPRREAGSSTSDARNALFGVTSILRNEPAGVND